MTRLPTPIRDLVRSVRTVGQLLDTAADHRRKLGTPVARVCAATCYQAATAIENLATVLEELAPIPDPAPSRRRALRRSPARRVSRRV